MDLSTWSLVFYVALVLTLGIFGAQYFFWLAMRRTRLRMRRWRRINRGFLTAGTIMILAGGIVFFAVDRNQTRAQYAGIWLVVGGVWNCILAITHRIILDILVYKSRGRR